MSSNQTPLSPTTDDTTATNEISKKAAKKEAAKQEKLRKKAEAAAASAAAAALSEATIDDPLADNYGDIPLIDLQSKSISDRKWTEIKSLNSDLKEHEVLIRGRVQAIRAVSKKMAFVVVREGGYTIQCVLMAAKEKVSEQMVKFANALSRESIVDVQGSVSVPADSIKGTSQQVEIQVCKIYCINRAVPTLPINIEDAARSEVDFEEAEKDGKQLVRVLQDTRLNYRVLDLRTPANQAIFHLTSFRGIHTPKLIGGTSEGGSAVFRLDYKGQPACLAQSPQLHKQCQFLVILGEFLRLVQFSEPKTHLLIGISVMDIVDRLFVAIFDHLNENCKGQLEVVSRQYPFKHLKYLRKTLQLTFQEGVQMLKEAGVDVDPHGDLSTETERKLGELVHTKYDTEFYILHRYPLAVRPFYTMPCYDDPSYSNSFDVFIRGEEIISGAQRVHDPDFLANRAEACGIDTKTIATYLDSFK
ncbi:Aspartate--tRNA ligase 2 cytoplasmic [Bienertia sinuspersici]